MIAKKSKRNIFANTTLTALLLSLTVAGCDEKAFHSFFPPKDFFEPILTAELQPGQLEYRGQISHNYAGDYSISLVFDQPTAVGVAYRFQALQIQCDFEMATKIQPLDCGNSLLPFWGEKNGMSIGRYSIPEVVAKNETVSVTLNFLNAVEFEDVLNSHGKVTLLIEKLPDL